MTLQNIGNYLFSSNIITQYYRCVNKCKLKFKGVVRIMDKRKRKRYNRKIRILNIKLSIIRKDSVNER